MTSHGYDDNFQKNGDMRYFPRWKVKNQVSYRLNDEKDAYYGRTNDISCAGACIIGDGHTILPHQKIRLVIELSDGIKLKINAHISWVQIENNRPKMGVTFYDVPDDSQKLILQDAFESEHDQLVDQWFKGWDGA